MYYIFVFFKQKTAYEMRISDWSSDVCSSDLLIAAEQRLDATSNRLLQAVEARSEGLAFWDRDDRLVMCNQAYRQQAGRAAPALVPGAPYRDYIRASAAAGEIPAAVGREEEWLRERFELRRSQIGRAHVCTPVTNA